MNKNTIENVWFPDIELLELFYNRKLTHFHGLGHILRVWTISMELAKDRLDKIDIDVLSAAALLHDIGRETDLREINHGDKSAVWIDEVLPVIAPQFTENQLEFIKILTILHCKDDDSVSTLELKILKDADALDRHRLPNGKIKKEMLRLPESADLIDRTRILYKSWNKSSRQIPTSKAWEASATDAGFEQFLPRKSFSTYDNLDKAAYIKRVRECDSLILTTIKMCQNLKRIYRYSSLTVNSIDLLSDFTKKVRGMTDRQDTLSIATQTFIYEYIWESLFDMRFSKGHSNEVEIRKNRFLKDIKERIYTQEAIRDGKSQYLFLQIQKQRQYKYVRKALIEYYAKYSKTNALKVAVLVLLKKYQKYLINIFGRLSSLSDRISLGTSLYLQEDSYKWTNLKIIQLWIDAFEQQTININGNSRILSEYLMGELNKLISQAPLNTEYINRILEQYIRLIEITKENGIKTKLGPLDTLLQQNISTNAGLCKMGKCGIKQQMSLFYLYTPYIKESQLSDYFRNLETLIKLLSERRSIDGVFKNYLIPLSTCKEWSYEVDPEIISAVDNLEIVEMYRQIQEGKNANPELDVKYQFIKERSQQNLSSFLKPAEYEPFLAPDANYKVTSNFIGLDLIVDIIQKKSDLLSIWNITNLTDRGILSKYALGDSNYYQRTGHRDSLQRHMLQRKPNFVNDHVYYGTLQDVGRLLENKNLFERIPSPTELFAKKRYGNVLLVFNDEIKKSTVFTLYDTVWENRLRPVVYSDAKYLYEKINRKPITSNFETHPLTILTSYIEADILNGVSLNDVEMIIVPKRLRLKKVTAIRKIQKALPNVEFRWV